jgi:hypothetical protein
MGFRPSSWPFSTDSSAHSRAASRSILFVRRILTGRLELENSELPGARFSLPRAATSGMRVGTDIPDAFGAFRHNLRQCRFS